MPSFGSRSTLLLSEAHPDLQRVMREAIKDFDFAVICGYRNKADQTKAKAEGKSNAAFGQSPHNFQPALAVDIVPWHANRKPNIDWEDTKSFEAMGVVVMAAADRLGIKLKWGKDFKNSKGQPLVDLPHFELLNWRDLK